jgi:hypothetical protein
MPGAILHHAVASQEMDTSDVVELKPDAKVVVALVGVNNLIAAHG